MAHPKVRKHITLRWDKAETVASWYRCFLHLDRTRIDWDKTSVSIITYTLIIIMMIRCFFMPVTLVYCMSWKETVNLTLSLCPSLHQLSLSVSKLPALTAGRWARPTTLRHGGHRSPPSLSPRSASGCSRALSGRIIAPRRNRREWLELRRRATRAPTKRLLLPVHPQTTWDHQVQHLHGQFSCSYLRWAQASLVLISQVVLG